MLDIIEKNIDHLIFINGLLDILNVFLEYTYNFSWYSLNCQYISIDFLFFVFLYGSVRIFDSYQHHNNYTITILTYIMEIVYFYNNDVKVSLLCCVISLVLINYQIKLIYPGRHSHYYF